MKTTKILFGIFLIAMSYSCCNEGIQIYSINDFSISSFNRNDLTVLKDSSIVNHDSFDIQIQLATTKEDYTKGNCGDDFIMELNNKITKLKITSNKDFDKNHPAGSMLNEYFFPTYILIDCIENSPPSQKLKCFNGNLMTTSNNKNRTLEDVINVTFSSYDFYHAYYEHVNYEIINTLRLNKTPDSNEYRKFILQMEFQNGQIIEKSTQNVSIE